jgi:hypothetical protein
MLRRANGNAIVLRMARIAVATMSSTRVKPEADLRRRCAVFVVPECMGILMSSNLMRRDLLDVHHSLRWRNLNGLHRRIASPSL